MQGADITVQDLCTLIPAQVHTKEGVWLNPALLLKYLELTTIKARVANKTLAYTYNFAILTLE